MPLFKKPKPPKLDEAEMEEQAPVEIPINGELDLHPFRPKEVKSVVVEYLQQCRKRGILEVRIVHGKGSGNLRRTVHATLLRLDIVLDFRLGDASAGSWGATLARLKPLREKSGKEQNPPQKRREE